MTRASKLTFAAILIAPSLAFAQAPQHSFDGLSCQSNIEHDLAGRQMPDEPTVKTEARYKSLNLKDDGADELGNGYNVIYWHICGDQYVVLQKKDRVAAVMKVPEKYRGKGGVTPCVAKDKTNKEYYFAVPGKGKGGTVTAEAAWMLDRAHMKFVSADAAALECQGDP